MGIKKIRWKSIGYYACLLFTMLLWWESLKNAGQIREGYKAVSLRYGAAALTLRQIEAAVKEDTENEASYIPDITLWDVADEVSVTEPELGRQTQGSLYETTGDMEQVLPGRWLFGGAVFREDRYGCVIDKNTAYDLFGAHSVEGKTISINGTDYTVRGVLDNSRRLVMIQSGDEDREYPNAELVFPGSEKEEQGTLAAQFLERHSFETPAILLDGRLLSGLAHVVSLLPACLLGLLSWVSLTKWIASVKGEGRRRQWLSAVIKFTAAAGAGAFLLWLCVPAFRLPDSFIPTRWSDFSFYSSKYSEILGQAERFFSSRLMVKDIGLAGRLLLCGLFSSYAMLTGSFFFSMTGRREPAQGRGWIWDITAVIVFAFLFILQAFGTGSTEKLPLSFPSVFLAVILIKRLTAGNQPGIRHISE